VKRALVLVLVLVLVGHACSDRKPENESRIAALATAVDGFDRELEDMEAQVRALSADFSEIAEAYERVSTRYRLAREHHAAVTAASNQAAAALHQAAEDWNQAAASWRFYRMLLKIAISIDQVRAGTSDEARRSFSCETMSTAAYRRVLIAQGFSLLGKDIDHIVPKALGGADHPSNYQVLDSSLNRSLGKTWNIEKCAMAGDERCAEAIAASTKCGTYRGGF
jgi:hypothetical protein